MPPRRRAKRQRLRAKPFLVVCLVLVAYLGVTRSALTSVRHVRVEGAADFDRQRIEMELGKLSGIPSAQINPEETEARIMSLPEVRSATLSRNIFGGAVLLVAYRTPVAHIDGTANLALAEDGTVYAAHDLPTDLPLLILPQNAKTPMLALADTWDPVSIAYLAQQARALDANAPEIIGVSERGGVNLRIGDGRVILGACDSLDRKLQVLRDRLSRNPKELSQIAELNLTSPERPAIRPKPSESSQ